MSSYNPTLTLGGASWAGNPPIATQKQLLSSISGVIQDFSGLNFSTLNVSTLNVPLWISTPILYVSDIQGATIDISGITINENGVFNAPIVSVSSMNMKGFDKLVDLDVSFDFGLGDALGGALGALGGLIGGGLIAVGTGAGLAIQGAEQGIATMVAGRPQNFINSSKYETINFTSQLQISTLGNAFPLYSSIFRTVSSIAPDQIPGREIFTSSFFLPGQICIRSASDPFNIISGNSNLNTSTIQSFGQWVPLSGLEPEYIDAQSVSTNLLSTEQAFIGVLDAGVIQADGILAKNTLQVGQVNAPGGLFLPYESYIQYQIGAVNYARQIGDINYWWFQSDQDIVFSKPGDPSLIPINASLSLGTGADQSLLRVSSIFSKGFIQAKSGYFSSLTVEGLLVVSSLSTIFTASNVTNISTSIITADSVFANSGTFSTLQAISSMRPFTFSGDLGYPGGRFDITRVDSFQSTTYNQVSSITQNILNYSLNVGVQDEPSFDMPNFYGVQPANANQWASTIINWKGQTVTGGLNLGFLKLWSTPVLQGTGLSTGTFDLNIYPNTNLITVYEDTNQYTPNLRSTFLQVKNTSPSLLTYRFTLQNNGWWTYLSPAPAPYATSNNNTFQIYQDINDTYIKATDRLHLVAGDILMDGSVSFSNFQTIQTETLNATFATISSLSTSFFATDLATTAFAYISTISTNNVVVNPALGGLNTYYYKPSTIGFDGSPTTVNPLNMTFIVNSPDFIPTYSLTAPFVGFNYFTSYNVSKWNNTIWNNNIAFSIGEPVILCGDVQTPLTKPWSGFFYVNNSIVANGYALPVFSLTAAGSNQVGLIAGNTFAKVATTNGINWTITTVPNPQGTTGGLFSNILNIDQTLSNTQITGTQDLRVQVPTLNVTTGTAFLYADQIRVNSRSNGFLPTSGLPSFPIGIENTVYEDNNIAWTYTSGTGLWQSDATNILYNFTDTIYYDVNSWVIQVIPSRFRTNDCPIYSWDVQPAIFPIGGGGYAWGYNRYIQVAGGIGGPGSGANNWNYIIAIPRNYCTN